MRSEVDADRLFKTEGKGPGKQSSSEDDLADESRGSTSSERKYHPHVLGITWTAMNLEIDLCSKLDFLHRCLEHIIWILAEACCFFVSKAFNHVLLKL